MPKQDSSGSPPPFKKMKSKESLQIHISVCPLKTCFAAEKGHHLANHLVRRRKNKDVGGSPPGPRAAAPSPAAPPPGASGWRRSGACEGVAASVVPGGYQRGREADLNLAPKRVGPSWKALFFLLLLLLLFNAERRAALKGNQKDGLCVCVSKFGDRHPKVFPVASLSQPETGSGFFEAQTPWRGYFREGFTKGIWEIGRAPRLCGECSF